jgi:hypothetical protein
MLKKIILVAALAVGSFASVGAVARNSANHPSANPTMTLTWPPSNPDCNLTPWAPGCNGVVN